MLYYELGFFVVVVVGLLFETVPQGAQVGFKVSLS